MIHHREDFPQANEHKLITCQMVMSSDMSLTMTTNPVIMSATDIHMANTNNNNNDRLTAFDPGQPG